MAKFTKLNIDDSVASSGGRVWKKLSAESAEVQDELQGTWVFNVFVSTNAEREFLFNFTSNGVDYYGLKTYIDLSKSYMAYKKSNGVYSDVYNFNEDMGGPETWTNDAYKTISITSKLSEVSDGDDLLSWLKANATKQGAVSEFTITLQGSYSFTSSYNAQTYIKFDSAPTSSSDYDYIGAVGFETVTVKAKKAYVWGDIAEVNGETVGSKNSAYSAATEIEFTEDSTVTIYYHASASSGD